MLYRVDPEAFYGPSYQHWANARLTERAMNGLISRYGLAGKTVLSLGAGDAFEEYWFHRAGCRLILNDIEAHYRFDEMPPGNLTWRIEDADKTVASVRDVDVLYCSGFHPDELRREAIQERFKKRRTRDQARRYVTWPIGEKPYGDTLINALQCTRSLAIFQHYRGGVYVDHNPHYIVAMNGQLGEHGFRLLDVYRFAISPAHLLVVATRHELELGPEISCFHGRYPLDNSAVRVTIP